MLKQLLKVKGQKSILATVKEAIPGPTQYLDDVVVLILVVGYAVGQYQGVDVFPADWVKLAIMYVIGKEFNQS